MPKRVAESARVTRYFATAPLDAAEALLGIAQETVKARRPPAARQKPKPKTAKAAPPEAQG